MGGPLRVATRGSALARWQANRVIELLNTPAELVIVSTTGDRRADVPIQEMGGQGVFVKEVEQAVLDDGADIAVHSAKDLPAELSEGLVLAAVPERADPRDALVGAALNAIPTGGLVGTGSVRRRAQLANLRPDLRFGELRGNIPTRLEKAANFDAVVVAAAALERLELLDRAAELLDPNVLLPQVAQGALAVECRADDSTMRERLSTIDDRDAHHCVTAERAFLAELGGGCMVPCGALARVVGSGVEIQVLIASPDGHAIVRSRVTDTDPEQAGRTVAALLLDVRGGRALLEDVVTP